MNPALLLRFYVAMLSVGVAARRENTLEAIEANTRRGIDAMKMTARPTEDILREAGWTHEPAKSDGMPDHWRDPKTGYLRDPNVALETVLDRNRKTAPRPTCGTCPHCQTPSNSTVPWCSLNPQWTETTLDGHCGQHPDMAAWIRDEWPKVKR